MHPKFVDILCCPDTQEQLKLEPAEVMDNGMVYSGELVSASGKRYPIIRGIPRFVSQEYYASSFGYEWKRWPRVQFESENIGMPMEGHTTRMWEAITLAGEGHVRNKKIVEFGCGPGRFLDVIRRKGGQAIGLDLSAAVEVARKNFWDDPDVLIVQGDLFVPPFKPGVFDGGYTIGVLHHTPDPSAGLKAMIKTIRTGGWVSCVVYPNEGFYNYPSVDRLRKNTNKLKPFLGYYPALFYSIISAYIFSPLIAFGKGYKRLSRFLDQLTERWIVSLYWLPDVRWRLLDTFDAITPEIASTHSGEEVLGWMQEAGCIDIKTANWGETSVVGIKS